MLDFPKSSQGMDRKTIYIGGYYVSRTPTVVKTVLGSCIATCLYEKQLKVGAMNHFMLPSVRDVDDYNNTRYGIFAMEVIINEIIKLGGKRKNMQAKIFGGGHVLDNMSSNSTINVSEKNIKFAKVFLQNEGIPIVKEDVGGLFPRKVFYFLTEDRVLMKTLDKKSKEFSAKQELAYEKKLAEKKSAESELTLF